MALLPHLRAPVAQPPLPAFRPFWVVLTYVAKGWTVVLKGAGAEGREGSEPLPCPSYCPSLPDIPVAEAVPSVP